MSALRGLAERAYAVAMARPTSNAGIDAIEDAIQAAVNDHTKALADALQLAFENGDHHASCSQAQCNCWRTHAGAALRLAGRL